MEPVTVASQGLNQIDVTWDHPQSLIDEDYTSGYGGNPNEDYTYIIEILLGSQKKKIVFRVTTLNSTHADWSCIPGITNGACHYTIRDLQSNTQYQIKVAAKNTAGLGLSSSPVYAKTLPPPVVVSNLRFGVSFPLPVDMWPMLAAYVLKDLSKWFKGHEASDDEVGISVYTAIDASKTSHPSKGQGKRRSQPPSDPSANASPADAAMLVTFDVVPQQSLSNAMAQLSSLKERIPAGLTLGGEEVLSVVGGTIVTNPGITLTKISPNIVPSFQSSIVSLSGSFTNLLILNCTVDGEDVPTIVLSENEVKCSIPPVNLGISESTLPVSNIGIRGLENSVVTYSTSSIVLHRYDTSHLITSIVSSLGVTPASGETVGGDRDAIKWVGNTALVNFLHQGNTVNNPTPMKATYGVTQPKLDSMKCIFSHYRGAPIQVTIIHPNLQSEAKPPRPNTCHPLRHLVLMGVVITL